MVIGLLASLLLHFLVGVWSMVSWVGVPPTLLPATPPIQVGVVAPQPSSISPPVSPPATALGAQPQPKRQRQTEIKPRQNNEPTPQPTPLASHEVSPFTDELATTESSATPEVALPEGMPASDIVLDGPPLADPPEPMVREASAAAPLGDLAITRSPPSAELHYEISLTQRGEVIRRGTGKLLWESQPSQYRVEITGQVIIQLLKQVSMGSWRTGDGLVPLRYTDQRLLRSETAVNFNREQSPPSLSFSTRTDSLPLEPGTQDSASLIMQLASLMASGSTHLYPGASVRFSLADTRKVREVTFRLADQPESVMTGMGRLEAWRFSYQAPGGSYERSMDIWFAREVDWHPVRLRYVDLGRDEAYDFVVQRRDLF